MTSKISYSKFISQNIKQRSWLAVVSAIGFLLLLPLYTIMHISTITSRTPEDVTKWARQMFSGHLNGFSNYALVAFIALLGLLCAVTGYSYLHSKVKQDFFHSMPVTRGQWFVISYLSGLLVFLVPYLISSIIVVLIGRAFHLMTAAIMKQCVIAALSAVFMFLIFYHISILAMTLTGQIVTGVLAAIALFAYQYLIQMVVYGLANIFFDTWSYMNTTNTNIFTEYSPIYLVGKLILINERSYPLISVYLPTMVLSVLLLVVSYILCKRYPSESAENALSFRKTGAFIKILITVPCALAIACITNLFMGNTGIYWSYFMGVLGALLICFIIEFIYHHDLKMLLKGKPSTFLSIILVFLIICIFDFDVFGYDTYIPKKEKLKSISFSTGELHSYFNFSSYFGDPENYLVSDDFDTIYTLIQNGVLHVKQHPDPEDDSQVSAQIRYTMKDGKQRYRIYSVDRKVLADVLSRLGEDRKFREELFPVFKLDPEQVTHIAVTDIYSQKINPDLTPDQISKLIDAYRQDLLQTDMYTLTNELPIGDLSFQIYDHLDMPSNETAYSSYVESYMDCVYIYDTFVNTLNLLEDFGHPIRRHINAADVQFLSYSTDGEFSNEAPAKVIYDRAEIQEVLDQLRPEYYDTLIRQFPRGNTTVTVNFNTGYSASYSLDRPLIE